MGCNSGHSDSYLWSYSGTMAQCHSGRKIWWDSGTVVHCNSDSIERGGIVAQIVTVILKCGGTVDSGT